VLRRLFAVVALWAILAGCSSPPGPAAAERSICKTVRTQLDALPKEQALPPYAASEAKQLLNGATPLQSTTVFLRNSFIHELILSHDATFTHLGDVLYRNAGDASAIGELDARCSALGL
jgi:hypothetical protein